MGQGAASPRAADELAAARRRLAALAGTRDFSRDDARFLARMAGELSAAFDLDPLTGLPSRDLAVALLREALDAGGPVAVLVVDLDRFKVINDSLGRAAGDAVLVAMAPRLQEMVGEEGTVARVSGDEFLVVHRNGPGGPTPAELATRLRDAVARPLELGGAEHVLSASIGIALSGGGESPQSLMEQADAAMYRAKDQGRGGYEVFDERLRRLTVARMQTERALRRALAQGQLQVAYQPIVELPDLQPVAVEALARWEDPELGPVPPAEFIPVAEDAGLIGQVGRSVLQQAARDTARWQERFDIPLMVWVNVSGREVGRPDFARETAAIARRSGLRPGTLALEITESLLMEEADSPDVVLAQLRELGVHLALDDFGTGYSSLSYLKSLPLDSLKIDRSFVSGVDTSEDDHAIVEATVEMAHALGLSVVAEGVETGSQLDALRWLGCDRAQGFLFARPQPAEELGSLLSRSHRPARVRA